MWKVRFPALCDIIQIQEERELPRALRLELTLVVYEVVMCLVFLSNCVVQQLEMFHVVSRPAHNVGNFVLDLVHLRIIEACTEAPRVGASARFVSRPVEFSVLPHRTCGG